MQDLTVGCVDRRARSSLCYTLNGFDFVQALCTYCLTSSAQEHASCRLHVGSGCWTLDQPSGPSRIVAHRCLGVLTSWLRSRWACCRNQPMFRILPRKVRSNHDLAADMVCAGDQPDLVAGGWYCLGWHVPYHDKSRQKEPAIH